MNSSKTKDWLSDWRYYKIVINDLMIVTLISKFYWTKTFVRRGTSYERILAGLSTRAIVPIYSSAYFFKFLSLSSSVSSAIGSNIKLTLDGSDPTGAVITKTQFKFILIQIWSINNQIRLKMQNQSLLHSG
jgi:hypothetical protein